MTAQFGMKLCNDQRDAQVFNLFIYLLLPYMFRGFLLDHLQRQVNNFGSGSSMLGMVSAPVRLTLYPANLCITLVIVQLQSLSP
jgi:hypothetical protein